MSVPLPDPHSATMCSKGSWRVPAARRCGCVGLVDLNVSHERLKAVAPPTAGTSASSSAGTVSPCGLSATYLVLKASSVLSAMIDGDVDFQSGCSHYE